jgi:hypothetical protein
MAHRQPHAAAARVLHTARPRYRQFLADLYAQQIAWMSEVRLETPRPSCACVTSFRTSESDIEWVVGEMSRLVRHDCEVTA